MSNISVAMAVYNGENYLPKQLDSILNQLDDTDELVISYDESTDNSLEIINSYKEKYPQIKVLFDPGKGVFSNFNNAIANCNNKYIFISDQDDVWESNKIRTVLSCFDDFEADMVIHNGIHIDDKDNIISDDFFSMYKITPNLLVNYIKPRYSGCCTAFKNDLKKYIIPIPENVGAYDHWIGMIGQCFGKTVFIDDVLIKHRIHCSNVTPTRRRNLSTILKARACLLYELTKLKIERGLK